MSQYHANVHKTEVTFDPTSVDWVETKPGDICFVCNRPAKVAIKIGLNWVRDENGVDLPLNGAIARQLLQTIGPIYAGCGQVDCEAHTAGMAVEDYLTRFCPEVEVF